MTSRFASDFEALSLLVRHFSLNPLILDRGESL
jgi:hypothetical protein